MAEMGVELRVGDRMRLELPDGTIATCEVAALGGSYDWINFATTDRSSGVVRLTFQVPDGEGQ